MVVFDLGFGFSMQENMYSTNFRLNPTKVYPNKKKKTSGAPCPTRIYSRITDRHQPYFLEGTLATPLESS